MADLDAQLEAARAEVARIQREIAAGPCRTHGHHWTSLGGTNAACSEDCSCSVPVNFCSKCGDCDYGESDEADEVRRKCKEMHGG